MQGRESFDLQDVDTRKVQTFKTIYRALSEGQDNASIYKTGDFLMGRETLSIPDYIQAIKIHIASKKTKKERRYSKTLQAWSLAQKYYDGCREDNVELFNAIYRFAKQNTWYSGSKFFRGPGKIKPLTSALIEEGIQKRDKIIFEIYYQLANPIPLGEIWPVKRSG